MNCNSARAKSPVAAVTVPASPLPQRHFFSEDCARSAYYANWLTSFPLPLQYFETTDSYGGAYKIVDTQILCRAVFRIDSTHQPLVVPNRRIPIIIVDRPSERPRVLHVVAPGRQGGAEQVITMMAVAQKLDGVHVAAVLVPGDADQHPFVVRLQALGVPVTRVVVRRRSYLTEYRRLRALMARLEPRIVHSHGYRADLIGGAAARALHIPRVSTVHGFVGGSLRNRVYERMQSMALRHMDAVLAVSRPLADRLSKAGVPANQIHFVPNGFAPLARSSTRGAARPQLGVNASTPMIGGEGRVGREGG